MNNKPIHEVRLGYVKAAIWENQVGDTSRYNVTFQRSYKDGTEWKNSDIDYDTWSHSQRFYRARDFSYENTVRIEGQARSTIDSSPIVGAVVSTSLDGHTAITDSNGHFRLVTGTDGDYGNVDYEIRVDADGFQSWMQSNNWGNTAWQEIYLTP